ncbi:MAG: hypothetical protein QM535_15910 [Limnohabitans sp.]|nr:hypothetical protein [Limnohabitans sp.]
MKNVIITLTIFLSFWKSTAQLEYQNDKVLGELGTGLVQQIDANKKNHFYIDKECKIESTKQKTIPLLNKPDYNIKFYICIEQTTSSYKILIAKGKYAYVKKTNNFKYYDWKTFLKDEVIHAEPKEEYINSYFDKINGKKLHLDKLSTDDETEITEVNGEWLKIHNATIKRNYYIRWRDKQRLLVYLNLLM